MPNAVRSLICSSAALWAAPSAPCAAQGPEAPRPAAQAPEDPPARTLRRPHQSFLKPSAPPPAPPSARLSWEAAFDWTMSLRDNAWFIETMGGRGFSPVGVARGDAAGDVGVWVRRHEGDPASARPALSLRRGAPEAVPPETIKIRVERGGRTVEKTLARHLTDLGLSHGALDKSVEVSRQFAIVPVPDGAPDVRQKFDPTLPSPDGAGASAEEAPQAAFNFCVNVGGDSAYVIVEGPAGGGGAVAGGGHRLLYADAGGRRAPLTIRASGDWDGPALHVDDPKRPVLHGQADEGPATRPMDAKGRGQGSAAPDAAVQRYCIIQVPLRRGAKGPVAGDFPRPPSVESADPAMARAIAPKQAWAPPPPPRKGPPAHPMAPPGPAPDARGEAPESARAALPGPPMAIHTAAPEEVAVIPQPRFARVAFGLGGQEGRYSAGGGFRGNRAAEPVRVTFVYFVAPKDLRPANMGTLAAMLEEMGGVLAALD